MIESPLLFVRNCCNHVSGTGCLLLTQEACHVAVLSKKLFITMGCKKALPGIGSFASTFYANVSTALSKREGGLPSLAGSMGREKVLYVANQDNVQGGRRLA